MSNIPEEVKNKLGLVQVYTGNGKGKTTASLGLAFRAAGRGLEVLYIQFLKPPARYGEHIMADSIPNITMMPMGLDHMVSKVPKEEDIRVAKETLAKAEELMATGKYDLVILDELVNVLRFKLLTAQEVIEALERRPEHIEVVLTGRGAPPELVDYADLVSEINIVKHPFDKGIHARVGIEY